MVITGQGDNSSPRAGDSPKPRASTEEMFEQTAGIEITPDIWHAIVEHPGAKEIFHDLEVADDDIINMFEVLDSDHSGTIDLGELVEGIAKLRGEARRSDIAAMFFMIKSLQSEMDRLSHTVILHMSRSPI